MARYIIETEDPDEFRRYFLGPKALAIISEFAEEIRRKTKYGDENTKSTDWDTVKNLFYEYCEDVLREYECE